MKKPLFLLLMFARKLLGAFIVVIILYFILRNVENIIHFSSKGKYNMFLR